MAARLLTLELLVTLVNVGLLLALLLVFLREWRRTRAAFSLGLVLFAGAFLLKEALRVLIVLDRSDGVPVIGGRLPLLVALGEAAALGILLYNVSK